jgi:hypothetical protein
MPMQCSHESPLSVALITNGPLAVIIHRIDDPGFVRQATETAIRESTAAAACYAERGRSQDAAAAFAHSFMLRHSLPPNTPAGATN